MQTTPKIHRERFLQQALVMDVEYVIYVLGSETNVLFICVVNVPARVQMQYLSVLWSVVRPFVKCAHRNQIMSSDIESNVKRTLSERLSFWIIVK